MLSLNTLSAFRDYVPGGLDPNKADALLFTFPLDSACGNMEQGWSMTLTYPDGGAYTDGSYSVLYVSDAGAVDPNATGTSSFGVALVANIAPTLGTFIRPVYTNANAGSCQVVNLALGYSGRMYVSAGGFSEQGVFLSSTLP